MCTRTRTNVDKGEAEKEGKEKGGRKRSKDVQ